jgi:hypothetical protein
MMAVNVNLSKARLRRLSRQFPGTCAREPSERFSVKETFSGIKTLANIFLEAKSFSKVKMQKMQRKRKILNSLSDVVSLFLVLANLVLGFYSIYLAI